MVTLCPPPQVTDHTDLEVGELGEGLLTARVWAFVGSVASVDSGDTHIASLSPPLPPPATVMIPHMGSHWSRGYSEHSNIGVPGGDSREVGET